MTALRPAVAFAALGSVWAVAQTAPKIENARLETRAVQGSLDSQFRGIVASAAQPAWIGYTTAAVATGDRQMCGTVMLEGATQFVVLYRASGGQVEKIRAYAADCSFDAGGLPLYWLTGVDGAESAALLASLMPAGDSKEERNLANSALSVIARHRDGVPVLIDIARHSRNTQTRKQAFFRLVQSKDPRAQRFFEEVLQTR